MSLYITHRPQTFDGVVGQDEIIAILKAKLKGDFPHVVLFAGPTGVGKTTLARVVASELGCEGGNLTEIDCADERGVDMVRDIKGSMRLSPMGGKCRVWLIDEVVQLPKLSQQAFLTTLEDTPAHVYFLLCTSDTRGLLPTFLGRCFQLHLKPLSNIYLHQIMRAVAETECKDVDSGVLNVIAQKAQGSARKALQLLEAAWTAPTPQGQLKAIGEAAVDVSEKVEFLALLLLRRAKWSEVANSLALLSDEDAEGIRRQVLAYAGKVLLSAKPNPHARLIIECFRENWLHCGPWAGLVSACWDCCQNK